MTAPTPDWLTEQILELPIELQGWDGRTVDPGSGQAVQRARVQKLAELLGAPECSDDRFANVVSVLSDVIPGLQILKGDDAVSAVADRLNEKAAGRPKDWGYSKSVWLIEEVDRLKSEHSLATDAAALRELAKRWREDNKRLGDEDPPKLRSLQTLLSRCRNRYPEASSTK